MLDSMQWPWFCVALAGLSLTVGMATLAPPVHAADVPGTTPAPPSDITVTAPRGTASGGIEPILELSPSELDAYGADSLSDLVAALRPLTRSSRSDQMAVVLINGHLAGQTEFDNLPREAIERIEVLPESVALQYGFSENQRVLNFVLRERYSAVPIRAAETGATEGGGQTAAADASLVRLNDEARISLLASYKDNAWLRDSDRGIDVPDSSYYTLLPDTTDTKVAATVSRSILGVSSSVEASYEVASARSLQGLATDRRVASQGHGESNRILLVRYLVPARRDADSPRDPRIKSARRRTVRCDRRSATAQNRISRALSSGRIRYPTCRRLAQPHCGRQW